MPTTIFLIMAAACFARSSPRLEARILAHSQFGPMVVQWRERRAIPKRGKMFAVGGIALGYGLFFRSAQPDLPLALFVGAVMVGIAVWISTRPT